MNQDDVVRQMERAASRKVAQENAARRSTPLAGGGQSAARTDPARSGRVSENRAGQIKAADRQRSAQTAQSAYAGKAAAAGGAYSRQAARGAMPGRAETGGAYSRRTTQGAAGGRATAGGSPNARAEGRSRAAGRTSDSRNAGAGRGRFTAKRRSAGPERSGRAAPAADVLVKSLVVFFLLAAALFASLFYYKAHRQPKVFPADSPAIEGIVSEVYRRYAKAGAAAETGDFAGQGEQTQGADPAAVQEGAQADGHTDGQAAENGGGASYAAAASYEELLTQIDSAIDAQDTGFLQQRLTYQDGTGNYQAYSDAQISGFAAYMKANEEERKQFFLDIADAGVYGGENQGSYVVKLPQIYFAITTDTDGTKVVVDTFEAAFANTADTLSKGPLLPMVYKIYATNEAWLAGTQTEVPVKVSDTSVSIAIKGNKGSGEDSGQDSGQTE